jgi:hypothetical protein
VTLRSLATSALLISPYPPECVEGIFSEIRSESGHLADQPMAAWQMRRS